MAVGRTQWELTVGRSKDSRLELFHVGKRGPRPIAGMSEEVALLAAHLGEGAALRVWCEVQPGRDLDVGNLVAVTTVLDDLNLWVARGQALVRAGDVERGIADLRAALSRRSPRRSVPYATLVELCRTLPPAAFAALEKELASWCASLGSAQPADVPLPLWSDAQLASAYRGEAVRGPCSFEREEIAAELQRRGQPLPEERLKTQDREAIAPPAAPPPELALPRREGAGEFEVYRDRLLECQHPYGEFIALDSSQDPSARRAAAKLRRKHEREWLGPLKEILQDLTYDRGRLVRAKLRGCPPEILEQALAHPLLDYIEELTTISGATRSRELRAGSTYLRFVERMASKALVRIDASEPAVLAIEGIAGRVTHLSNLWLTEAETQEAVRAARMTRLEWVEVCMATRDIVDLLELLEAGAGFEQPHRIDLDVHITSKAGVREGAVETMLRAATRLGRLPFRSVSLEGTPLGP
jgi:hypothetical protein